MQRQSPQRAARNPTAASPSPRQRAQPKPPPAAAPSSGLALAGAPGRVLRVSSHSEEAWVGGAGSAGPGLGSVKKTLGFPQDPGPAFTRPGAEVHVSAACVPGKPLLKRSPEAGSIGDSAPARQSTAQTQARASATSGPGPAALCNGAAHASPSRGGAGLAGAAHEPAV